MGRATALKQIRSGVRERVFVVFGLISAFWLVWALDEFVFGGQLKRYGIQPREQLGLRGVLFAPFLHGNMLHLVSNTIPFAILGLLVAMKDASEFLAVTAIVTLIGGLGTWLLGTPGTTHIGASVLVFGYFGYLLARAFYDRGVFSFLVAIAVAVLYGGMIWGMLPFSLPHDNISWEGHLSGAIGGFIAARMFHRTKSR